MHILQGGAPKCGNFWLYQIIQQVLARAGHDTTSFIQKHPIYALARDWDLNYPDQAKIDVLEITDLQCSYRISSIFRMPIPDIGEYVAQTNHVWTHSPICKTSGQVLELFDKKVYIIRDPRDRALSAARYYTSDYMLKYFPQQEKDPQAFLEKNFEALMHEWVWHVYDHLRLSQACNIYITFYEAFLLDFQHELGRLLDYLEIGLNQAQRASLAEAMQFTNLQKQNPKHLKRGEAGYWRNQLTAGQIETADRIAGPLIRFLNYPGHAHSPLTCCPQPAHRDFEKLKAELCT